MIIVFSHEYHHLLHQDQIQINSPVISSPEHMLLRCKRKLMCCSFPLISRSIVLMMCPPSFCPPECAVDREYYKETNGKISVKCMVNTGSYAEEQVQGSFKFCVDKDGIRSGPLVGGAGHTGEDGKEYERVIKMCC